MLVVLFDWLSVFVDELEWDGEMLEYNIYNSFFYRLVCDMYNCNGGVVNSWVYFDLELYYFMLCELVLCEDEE